METSELARWYLANTGTYLDLQNTVKESSKIIYNIDFNSIYSSCLFLCFPYSHLLISVYRPSTLLIHSLSYPSSVHVIVITSSIYANLLALHLRGFFYNCDFSTSQCLNPIQFFVSSYIKLASNCFRRILCTVVPCFSSVREKFHILILGLSFFLLIFHDEAGIFNQEVTTMNHSFCPFV